MTKNGLGEIIISQAVPFCINIRFFTLFLKPIAKNIIKMQKNFRKKVAK